MKTEWFAAKELIGFLGLPTSTQGINSMARRQGWLSRRRKGVQGRALEYHIDSLPHGVKKQLTLNETTAIYATERQDPLKVWIEYYCCMTETERSNVISFLMREGVSGLLTWIDKQNQ